MIHYRHN